VKAIDVYEGELEEAFTPQSVTIRLEDEIDVSRGDMLVHAHDLPHVRRTFDAYVVWMNETPLDREKSYLIKHTTQYVRAEVRDLHFKVDMGSLENVPFFVFQRISRWATMRATTASVSRQSPAT